MSRWSARASQHPKALLLRIGSKSLPPLCPKGALQEGGFTLPLSLVPCPQHQHSAEGQGGCPYSQDKREPGLLTERDSAVWPARSWARPQGQNPGAPGLRPTLPLPGCPSCLTPHLLMASVLLHKPLQTLTRTLAELTHRPANYNIVSGTV